MSPKNEEKSEQKEVIFYSDSAGMTIGANAVEGEERVPGTGQIMHVSRMIHFEGKIYRTSDPKEIEHIRNTGSYKIGKIREINETGANMITTGKVDVKVVETSPTH